MWYADLIDRLVFSANFSSISAISWSEQILYYIIYKIIWNKTYCYMQIKTCTNEGRVYKSLKIDIDCNVENVNWHDHSMWNVNSNLQKFMPKDLWFHKPNLYIKEYIDFHLKKMVIWKEIFLCVFFLNFSLKGTVVKFYKESVSGCWADAKLLYNLLYWTDPTWYDSNCINHKQVSNVSIPANLSFLHQLSLKLVKPNVSKIYELP